MVVFIPRTVEDWEPYRKHMYLDKIKAWGIVKQYRAADVERIEAMVLEAKLTGRPLDEFTFRGRPINLKKLSSLKYRHRNRLRATSKGELKQSVLAACIKNGTSTKSAAGTPLSFTAVVLSSETSQSSLILTPSPNSRGTGQHSCTPSPQVSTLRSWPSSLLSSPKTIILEKILLQLQTFLRTRRGVSSGAFHQSFPTVTVTGHRDGSLSDACSCAAPGKPTLFSNISMCIYYLKSNSRHLAFPLLHKTCEAASKAMPPADQDFLVGLLATLSASHTRSFPEIRKMLLEFLSGLCPGAYGRNHPVTLVCQNLLQDGADDIELSTRALSYMLKTMESNHNFGPAERCTLQRALTSHYRRAKDLETAEKLCHRSIEYCEMAFGPHSEQACSAIEELVYVYTYQGRYNDGLDQCSKILRVKKNRLGPKFPDCRSSFVMENMAELYEHKGNVEDAVAWLRGALHSSWAIRGGVDTTIHVRDKLERLYESKGDFEAARALHQRYPADIGVRDEVHTDTLGC